MKKIMGIILSAAIVGTSISSFAAVDGISYNQTENAFSVNGSISLKLEGKKVKIIVTNPGYLITDLATDFGNALCYTNEVYTKEDGSYEFEIPFSEANVSGEYSFYVQDDEAASPEKLTAYYADIDEKDSIIEGINNGTLETMADILKEAIKALNLDEELVSDVIDESAELLHGYKETTPITTDNAKRIIEGVAVVAAFNEGKTDLLFEDGKYIRNEIVDFSSIDKDGVTLYEIYTQNMSDEGKKEVIEGLYNNSLKNENELLDKFAELVFIKAIKYSANDGTGHVKEILSKKNAEKVKVSVKAYLDITNNTQKKKVELDLMCEDFESAKALETKLPSIVSKNKQTTSGGSNGGSSGGSNGGGVGSLVVTPIENGTNASPEVTGFSDMKDTPWAEEAVKYLYKNGIVSGTGNNMFSPQASVTREQFAVMLINSLGEELKENDGKFADVVSGSYYEKHVATGVEMGIIKGISDELFGTGKTITRQDLCTLIYRAYFSDEEEAEKLNFKDSSDISDYAVKAVSKLYEKGIISGFPDETFRPKELCTRAQAAKMLYGAIIYNN